MGLLQGIWHALRPVLEQCLGRERLEKLLYRIRFYQIKSRILIRKGQYPEGIELWQREPDMGIVAGVLVHKSYERAKIQDGDVVLDVGGHIGSYTVLASKKVGEAGHVHSFEPEPENHHLLKKNIALNRCLNVSVYPIAMSDETKSIDFFVREPPERHSIMGGSGAIISVPSRRLDDMVSPLKVDCIGVLKIDAEGAELKILSGAVKTLPLVRQVILELHKEWVSLESITQLLSANGFAVEILKDNPEVAIVYAWRPHWSTQAKV